MSEPQKGLGDSVAALTRALGVDKLAAKYEKVTGKPCGCKERQEKLNKMFPYKHSTGPSRFERSWG